MHYKEVKAILSPQNGLNIYRGCSYSCVFCDARSTCHRMDHEFEDIEVKAHAVDMLEYALKKKRTRSMIQIGSSSEPYIPLEEELQLVRTRSSGLILDWYYIHIQCLHCGILIS